MQAGSNGQKGAVVADTIAWILFGIQLTQLLLLLIIWITVEWL